MAACLPLSVNNDLVLRCLTVEVNLAHSSTPIGCIRGDMTLRINQGMANVCRC